MDQQQRERRRVTQRARRQQSRQSAVASRRTAVTENRQQQQSTADANSAAPTATSHPHQQLLHQSALPTRYRCGRNFTASQPFLRHILPQPTQCRYCAAKLFHRETSANCCSSGKLTTSYPPPPPELLTLFNEDNERGLHFRTNIRSYNNAFAFTSMGANIDQHLASARSGIYSYRAQGSIYHSIGSVLPLPGSRPRYLQMYIYDTDHEVDNRQQDSTILKADILQTLQQILDFYNPYVHVLRQLGQRTDLQDCRLIIKELTVNRHFHQLPTASQVAGIIVGDDCSNNSNDREIIVQTRSGTLQRVSDTAVFYDPLQYPLLFPRGEQGWDVNMHNTGQNHISCRAYYSHLLQVRPTELSLLLLGGRLLQQFVVDTYVKIETMRLRYLRDHQGTIRADLYQGLQDALASGETTSANVGVRKVLPSSHIGSPRDMHQRYQDAMAIVRRYGKPDLFITVTCNPNWTEITQDLLPFQQPYDRPDLTTRVFRAKLEQLKVDLFDKHVLGRVIAHVHVIEFQKRGLPHAHILLILADTDKLNTADDYDTMVRAEIPNMELEPDLYTLVIKHMIHHPCGNFNPTAVCMRDGTCKKGFPKPFAPSTLQGSDSYPIYRRRDIRVQGQTNNSAVDNRWVVPYNPYLLLKYDCHINVEICSSIKSVKYLYKYVYKGSDRVSVSVSSSSSTTDEISQFVNARWVCAPESLWRIFKFQLSSMSPSVIGLQIHLPNNQHIQFNTDESLQSIVSDEHRTKTMLTEFFSHNLIDEDARQYLYHEFPENYWWNNEHKQWVRRQIHRKVIGRLYTVPPTEGDRYYLRLLLNHIPGPLSFTHLRTVNDIVYSTFKESAEHRELLENDNSIKDCLTDASNTHMPLALRRLFVTILVYCEPCGVRDLWDEFWPSLTEDYLSTSSASLSATYLVGRCLFDLNNLLKQYNRTIFDYDFPHDCVQSTDEYNNSTLLLEEQSIQIPLSDLQAINKLTTEQKEAFAAIMLTVDSKTSSIYFIDGPGGTGKTFLYKAILAQLRNRGLIAIATATSGIASIALPGGRTAHSRFKIPINLNSTSTCHITKQSDTAKLLSAATVLLWDEATMAHRHAFEALDRTLRDLTNADVPFGGKIVILGGDFRQVLPIVPGGTRAQTSDACIVRSYLWSNVKVFHLTKNMRARADQPYADFVLRVGNGTEPTVHDDMIKLPSHIVIRWDGPRSLHRLTNEIFPALDDNFNNTNYMLNRVILSPTNETVDEINNIIINQFPGDHHIYYSFDKIEDDQSNLYQTEFLHSLNPGGMPPHKLTLKEGCPIMFLRNIDPRIGLCNGMRLICRVFHRNLIDAEISFGQYQGTRVFIPRIPLKPSENIKLPFNLIRKQFPVRLAFALTINKSQGQTIPHVGIYLPSHVFGHGQLYVALSRGTSSRTTKILVANAELRRRTATHTRNVVYHDVLHACSQIMHVP